MLESLLLGSRAAPHLAVQCGLLCFCLFREAFFCFSGFTFFRLFFIQFSRYRCAAHRRFPHISASLSPLSAARRIDAFLTSLQVSRRCPLRGWILSNQPLVGSSGLEPPTSRLSGVRSNHLSYEPISGGRPWPCHVSAYLCVRLSLSKHPMVEMNRIELSTPCLQGRCSPS